MSGGSVYDADALLSDRRSHAPPHGRSTPSNADAHRLLPRFQGGGTFLERSRMERDQGQVLLAAMDSQPTVALRYPLTKPGGTEELRGIPAIARGVAGVQPGSSPLQAVIAAEGRLDWAAGW